MPKFIGTLAEISFNTKKFVNTLDKEANIILVEGIRAWLDTMTSIVPNWSGMSLASLQSLGDKVGVTVNVFSVPGVRNRVAEGRSLGTASVSRGPAVYSFEWKSNVKHFVINEQFDARQWGFRLINPGPYNAISQANDAFTRKIDPLLRDLLRRSGFKVIVKQRKI